ncbi:MAG: hypothetical protein EPN48_15595 [Microbacteriaceae bacterium]|nr:MAG: hypothetical protein EPN48_15595 [Microbacteriaceae bacterium]
MVVQGGVDGLLNGVDECRLELNGAVVLKDSVFDHFECEVSRVASPFLTGTAEEVEVVLPVSPEGALDNHATVRYTALGVALAAPQAALQIMRVDALAFTRPAGADEHVLDLHEQIPVNNRLVPPRVNLALVDELANVVTIP